MTTRKSTRGARAPQIKLSQRANARAVETLLETDPTGHVFSRLDELFSATRSNFSESRAVFDFMWREATRAVEAGGASKAARKAYDELADLIRRTRAGESVEAIEAERVRKMREASEYGARRLAPTPELLRRADEIIPDARGYDVDSRGELRRLAANVRNFKEKPDDVDELRRALARVERGECIADFTGIKPEKVAVAKAIVALLDMDGKPDFLTNGIMTMLWTVQDKTGAKLWRETEPPYVETGGWSLPILARVCERDEAARIEFEAKHDLADHIAAVLQHKDTPQAIREGILDGLSQYSFNDRDPAYIRLVLAGAQEKEGDEQREGGTRR